MKISTVRMFSMLIIAASTTIAQSTTVTSTPLIVISTSQPQPIEYANDRPHLILVPATKGPDQYYAAYQQANVATQLLQDAKEFFAPGLKNITEYKYKKDFHISLDEAKCLSYALTKGKDRLLSWLLPATTSLEAFARESAASFTKQTGNPFPLLYKPEIYPLVYKPSTGTTPDILFNNVRRALMALCDVSTRLFMPLEDYGTLGYNPLYQSNANIYQQITGFYNAQISQETVDLIKELYKNAVILKELCAYFPKAVSDFTGAVELAEKSVSAKSE